MNAHAEKTGSAGSDKAVAVKETGWFGVAQSDMAASERFFGELLELDEWDRTDGRSRVSYQLPSGQRFAIMSQTAPNAELHGRPLVGLAVDDAAATKQIMEARGLAFSSELQRGPEASWAFFQDPDGHTHKIISQPPPRVFDQTGKQLKIKGVGTVEVPVKDRAASVAFFQRYLDLTIQELPGEQPFTLFRLESGNVFEVIDADMARAPYPIVAFEVDDIEASRRVVSERGIGVSEAFSAPAAQWFYLDGPDGITYEIIEIDRGML